ncbi:DUF6801 domain-containing protein [Actinomadura sp. 21ATH]|uniref:DUF6801 domain-containing protein n=1 Tax=Actinomadura sp. 21ATH TaxID=1735444 RepID=UPI0035C0DC21
MRTRPGRRAWPVRLAGAGAVMVLAALLTSAEAVAAVQRADLTLTYSCGLASGPKAVTVRLKGEFPATAAPGAQIRPEKIGLTVTASRAALAGIVTADTATVAGRAGLQTLVTQDRRPTGAEWPGLTVKETAVRGKDPVVLTATGPVPAATLAATGDAVFSAGELALRLDPRKADGTSAGTPAPLSCTPALGQDTTFVTVPLGTADGEQPAGGDPAPGQGNAPGQRNTPRAAPEDACPAMPEGGLNPDFPKPTPEPGSDPQPPALDRSCARVDGNANVDKLKGASKVSGAASVLIGVEQFARFRSLPDDHGYVQARTIAKSYLDSIQSTFLTFDFMPTTAKMEITQLGNANAIAEGPDWADSPHPTRTRVHADVSIRLFDVRVNGTPMDVGPNCRAEPARLVVQGNSEAEFPYRVEDGGLLTGTVDLPGFKGCGVGENLDRLFTASVSSKGNYVRLVQGPVCYVDGNASPNIFPCPPTGYGYTNEPGGDWRATSGPLDFKVSVGTSRSIVCDSSTITGSFKNGSQIPPVRLGTLKSMRFHGCKGAGSGLAALGPVELTVEGLPSHIRHNPQVGFDASTGTLNLNFLNTRMTGRAGACTFAMNPNGDAGYMKPQFIYKNGESRLTFDTGTIATLGDNQNCSIRLSGTFGPREAIVYTLDNPQNFKYGTTTP